MEENLGGAVSKWKGFSTGGEENGVGGGRTV